MLPSLDLPSYSVVGLHSEVRVTRSVRPPLYCVPPTFDSDSHSAVSLHYWLGLCCVFGLQAHFGIPLFIHPLLWVQTPGWISLPLCSGPPILGLASTLCVPTMLSLASTSFCACNACSGLHFLVCLLPSFWPPLWNWRASILLTPILQWPSTLDA